MYNTLNGRLKLNPPDTGTQTSQQFTLSQSLGKQKVNDPTILLPQLEGKVAVILSCSRQCAHNYNTVFNSQKTTIELVIEKCKKMSKVQKLVHCKVINYSFFLTLVDFLFTLVFLAGLLTISAYVGFRGTDCFGTVVAADFRRIVRRVGLDWICLRTGVARR